MDAALLHAVEIKLRVFLFVPERLINTFAERGGRLGKTQQHERHQFRGEQFVIGEEVKELSTFGFLLQIFRAGKTVARFAGRFELQLRGPTGRGGRRESRTGAFIGDVGWTQEFFLQRRGEQNALGKFTKFHVTRNGVTVTP